MDRDEAMARSFGACQTVRDVERVSAMWVLGDLLIEILTTPPPVREHWWQFWRSHG